MQKNRLGFYQHAAVDIPDAVLCAITLSERTSKDGYHTLTEARILFRSSVNGTPLLQQRTIHLGLTTTGPRM